MEDFLFFRKFVYKYINDDGSERCLILSYHSNDEYFSISLIAILIKSDCLMADPPRTDFPEQAAVACSG